MLFRDAVGALVTITLVAGAAGCGDDEHEHEHEHGADGIPAAYAGLTNPLTSDAATLSAGSALYTAQCARCHGDTGAGDGGDGAGLSPAVPDLSTHSNADYADDYLFYRISDGGADPYFSSMPAFSGTLSETERWQLVLATRELVGD